MASVKRKVKKYIKRNEPTYKGLDRKKKKLVKARFEERVDEYRKELETARRKKRVKRFSILFFCIFSLKIWRAFHSKEAKKYKRRELGRR